MFRLIRRVAPWPSLVSGALASVVLGIAIGVLTSSVIPGAQSVQTAQIVLSDKLQTVHLYYPSHPAKALVVLSSDVLGWVGLVVDVAQFLHGHDIAVLGLSTRAYLASFTGAKTTLDPAQISAHYETVVREAHRLLGVEMRPVLIGISEGAGLSVIAAGASSRRSLYRGVITLSLPESIELGWNRWWSDWTIWLANGNRNQPHLVVAPDLRRVSPLPLIMVQSSRDAFIPPQGTRGLYDAAQEPKRVYPLDAKNARFSGRQLELRRTLLDALTWIDEMDR